MANPALGAYGISYVYPSQAQKAVAEISFEVEQGEILALLGPNGCGKSTLLRIVSGILPLRRKSCEGQVRVRGTDFLSLSQSARARQVAYVGYDLRAEFPITASQAVWLGRTVSGSGLLQAVSAEDREQVAWAMDQALCSHLADRDLHELSGGQRQLVALARALAQGARILCLDEALSQMDLNHQAVIGKLLRRLAGEGYSVILVSHDLNLASEWADSCLLMKAGQKAAHGKIAETLSIERIQALYPGADLLMGRNPATGAPKVFFGKV